MGTRGTIAVRVNGETKGAYNHWDSYYSGLGEEMLAFAKTLQDTDTRAEYKALAEAWATVPDREPNAEEIERCAPFTDLSVSTGSTSDWYCLLRNTQGDLPLSLKAGLYEAFPVGEEEYSYVIDFDANTFECYEGRHKTATFSLDDLPKSLRVINNVPDSEQYYG